MYLYPVDNAVTYTSEDLVLFRESPFACWMERLTLENPDHGIAPDPGSTPPRDSMTRQDDLAETLRAEGKDVVLVDWEADESQRRAATLRGMREGADFIVNGRLALGPLSGSANLLMRTSGYSELGDYLYIPCDTQGKTSLQSAFRLCFLADLLHSLQGQLPPQMLIIRDGEIVPLQTEDHIYHYRAVKHRFMQAMREFRKHRMPDPAESSHFGRWSACANALLKQRALKRQSEWREPQEEAVTAEAAPLPQQAVAGSAARAGGHYAQPGGMTRRTLNPGATPGAAVIAPGGQVPSGPTLAEQARMLAPVTAPPQNSGSGRDRGSVATVPAEAAEARSATARSATMSRTRDPALENLAFIGRSSPARPSAPASGQPAQVSAEPADEGLDRDAPYGAEPLPLMEVEEISLDGTLLPRGWGEDVTADLLAAGGRADESSGAPAGGDAAVREEGDSRREAPSPALNRAGGWRPPGAVTRPAGTYSAVDPDGGTFVSPPAGLVTSAYEEPDARSEGRPRMPAVDPSRQDTDEPLTRPAFSDSLITSDSYDE